MSVSDFCYSLPVLERIVAQAEMMDTMMAKVGVDPLIAIRRDAGAAWFEARTRCIDCLAAGECRQWHAAAAFLQRHGAPQFCPNRDFFEACLRQGLQAA